MASIDIKYLSSAGRTEVSIQRTTDSVTVSEGLSLLLAAMVEPDRRWVLRSLAETWPESRIAGQLQITEEG